MDAARSTPEEARAGAGRARPRGRLPSLWSLWFGVLIPPLAWAAHLLGTYYVVSLGCATVFGTQGLWVQFITAITGAVTIIAGLVAWWNWRRTGTTGQVGGDVALGRSGFMALSGILSSVLFVALIVVGDFGPWFLNGCR